MPNLWPRYMNCLGRTVLQHIKAYISPGHDQHHFTYRSNRFTDTLYTNFDQLEKPQHLHQDAVRVLQLGILVHQPKLTDQQTADTATRTPFCL